MELFTIENLFTLMLTLLQIVLGLDNLLYTLLNQKDREFSQKIVRQIGIAAAVVLRIILLFLIIRVIGYFQESLFHIDNSVMSGDFNIHSLIVLCGGIFIIYTTSEILHMLNLDKNDHQNENPNLEMLLYFQLY